MASVSIDAQRLVKTLSKYPRLIVAFSGGVDSSVVAAAAHRANIQSAVAVTAQSPSVPQWQLQIAQRVAAEIGIEHRIVKTQEGVREEYRRNDRQRCYYCKDTLYQTLNQLADSDSSATIISGTNADDLGDYRPGISAGNRHRVFTPLADLGFSKTRVRKIAEFFELSNWDLPASPCLASRVAYGVEVTAERLQRIEFAESLLRDLGFIQLRVRLLAEEQARIEVEKDSIDALLALDSDGSITKQLLAFGFESVMIDRQGFRSGRLNEALSPATLIAIEPMPKSAGRVTDPKEVSR